MEGEHYFVGRDDGRLYVINWGAHPAAAGPASKRIVDLWRFVNPQAEAGARGRGTTAGEARYDEEEEPRRPWWLLLLLPVVGGLVWWLRPQAAPPPAPVPAATPPPRASVAPPSPPPSAAPPPALEEPLPTPHQRIAFAVDDDALAANQRASLEAIASYLRSHADVKKLRIEGHADRRGLESGNQSLSLRRAKRVERWLLDHGIAANRLEAVGCGARHPLDPHGTPRLRINLMGNAMDVGLEFVEYAIRQTRKNNYYGVRRLASAETAI